LIGVELDLERPKLPKLDPVGFIFRHVSLIICFSCFLLTSCVHPLLSLFLYKLVSIAL
jgi:hypothetical protein